MILVCIDFTCTVRKQPDVFLDLGPCGTTLGQQAVCSLSPENVDQEPVESRSFALVKVGLQSRAPGVVQKPQPVDERPVDSWDAAAGLILGDERDKPQLISPNCL